MIHIESVTGPLANGDILLVGMAPDEPCAVDFGIAIVTATRTTAHALALCRERRFDVIVVNVDGIDSYAPGLVVKLAGVGSFCPGGTRIVTKGVRTMPNLRDQLFRAGAVAHVTDSGIYRPRSAA